MERDQVLFRLFGKYSPQGTILYTEGSPGEELFLVQSGAVRTSTPGGGPACEAVLGPGDVLGEESFFGRAPRACRAEALKDCRLLLVNDRNLDAVVRHGPEVAAAVTGRLLERAATESRRLESWVLAHRLRRAEPHLLATLPGEVTPDDLAELSGLALAEARSVLDQLVLRGLLAPTASGYRVPDAGALARSVRELIAGAEQP